MRVMVFGTFDNLHPGHLHYFWSARRFGAKQAGRKSVDLIVVVARDNNVRHIKGRQPQQTERQRAAKIRAAFKVAGWSGQVVPGGLKNKWAVLKKYQPDFIGLGYDQQVDIKQLKKALAEAGLFCKIKRLTAYHPEKYKSSYCRGEE